MDLNTENTQKFEQKEEVKGDKTQEQYIATLIDTDNPPKRPLSPYIFYS